MMDNITRDEFEGLLKQKLQVEFNVTPDVASDNQIYKALCSVVVDYLRKKRRKFTNKVNSQGKKQVYYMSMEFLMGRSLKTNLFNLQIN